MNSEVERGWNALTKQQKKETMKRLSVVMSVMETKAALEMLCCAIKDLHERIEALEKECDGRDFEKTRCDRS